jgi:hypothetical protein
MAQCNVITGEVLKCESANELLRYAELPVVSLRHPIDVDGRPLPAGTKGTVVAAYADGFRYEVEVFEPFHVVISLGGSSVAASSVCPVLLR